MGSVETGLKRSWSPCRFQRRQSDCPHSVHAPRIMHCACSLFFLHGAHMEHLSCVLALISLHTHAHTSLLHGRVSTTRREVPHLHAARARACVHNHPHVHSHSHTHLNSGTNGVCARTCTPARLHPFAWPVRFRARDFNILQGMYYNGPH